MLQILFQNEDYVAVNKPSGMVVHRSRMATDRVSCLSLLREQLGAWVYPLHRLDRGTSGVLMFALSREAASDFARLHRDRQVQKIYFAIARGYVAGSGVVDKPLASLGGGKLLPAVSRYACVARAEIPRPVGRYLSARYSLVRVETESGRLHQVRRHLRSLSHPLIGDAVYGDGRHNRFFYEHFGREHFGVRRLLLEAKEIRFTYPRVGHPLQGREMRIEAPWSAEWLGLFSALGWGTIPEAGETVQGC